MPDEQLAFGWVDPEPAVRRPLEPVPAAIPIRDRLQRLAGSNIYIGTSSWKYPGWLGQVYNPERYVTRGQFSAKRFNDECLSEYAGIFPTVCGDFAFYQFPTAEAWAATFSQVPAGFRFAMKVPEDVTVDRFPQHPRYGRRAGADNAHFMDASLLRDQFLDLLEPYHDRLGPVILQFGTLHRRPARDPAEFAERLDGMLSQLPVDRFDFAVEVRNREFLAPGSDYLACLRQHRVAHCLNSWTRMPALGEQLRIDGIFTAPHAVARFLLKPGRNYQEAVEQFAPYDRVRDPYPEGREALTDAIRSCLADKRTLFAFVNNRFEGNAIETIELATQSFASSA